MPAEHQASMALYGTGGHAKVVQEIAESCGWHIARRFDDAQCDSSSEIYPGIHHPSTQASWFTETPVILCIGDNLRRYEVASHLPATVFPTLVHPSAVVSPTTHLGVGTVVMQQAAIQAAAQIGSHAIINTAASVDHDCEIGDFAHIAPHASLCGGVQVGEGTLVGAGSTILPQVKIGRWCTIGAGSVVLKDVPDHATVVGNPARIIRIDTIVIAPKSPLNQSSTITSDGHLASVRQHINEVLASSRRAALESISLEQRLQQDLGLDSLELAELTVRLESETGVDVFADGVVRTVGEVVERIEVGNKR